MDGRGLRLFRHIRIGVGLDFSVADTHDSGRVLPGKLRVVRDHDDEAVLCDLLQKVHDLHARVTVESSRRFIREHDVRVIDEGARDRDALHLSAGHLVRLLVHLFPETDLSQGLLGALLSLRAGNAGDREGELDI